MTEHQDYPIKTVLTLDALPIAGESIRYSVVRNLLTTDIDSKNFAVEYYGFDIIIRLE